MGPELEVFDVRSMMEKCRGGGGFHWRPATSTSHGGLEVGVGGVELRYYDLLEASKGNRLARFVSWQWEPDKIRRMFVWLILLSKPWRQSSVLGLNSVLTHTHTH